MHFNFAILCVCECVDVSGLSGHGFWWTCEHVHAFLCPCYTVEKRISHLLKLIIYTFIKIRTCKTVLHYQLPMVLNSFFEMFC